MGVEQERKVKAVDKEKSKKAVEEKLNCEKTKKAGGKKKKPTPPKPKPKKPKVVAPKPVPKPKKPTPKRTPQSVYAEHVAKLTAKTPKVSAGRKKHFEKLSKRVKKLKVVATEAKFEHKVKERQH